MLRRCDWVSLAGLTLSLLGALSQESADESTASFQLESLFSDEKDCSLQLLQLAGRSSHQSSELDWLQEAFLEQRREALAEPLMCGDKLLNKKEEDCCGNISFPLKTSACCNGKIYSLSTEGCCDDRFVYTYSSQTCDPSQMSSDTDFVCKASWPPVATAPYWQGYCRASSDGHKAWAMTPSCKWGWLVMNAASSDEAQDAALKNCSDRAAGSDEECKIFDLDGSACPKSDPVHIKTCGDVSYDDTVSGCCGGTTVYNLISQGCCNDERVFNAQKEDCCAGTVYTKSLEGCCGNKILFNAASHGCCLNKGAQVYKFGTHNCCYHPPGTCKIPKGRASCCS